MPLSPLVGGLGLLGSGLVADPFLTVLMLTATTIGIYSFFGPFWTLPALFLAPATAAVGIAVINSIGHLGGFIGLSIVGGLTGVTGSSHTGLLALGASLLVCSLLVYLVRVPIGAEHTHHLILRSCRRCG